MPKLAPQQLLNFVSVLVAELEEFVKNLIIILITGRCIPINFSFVFLRRTHYFICRGVASR